MTERTDTTILVVDDEEDVADGYAAHLQTEYETQVAYGGQDALDTVTDETDIILLDRRMPDMSGDAVLDEIRNRGLECHVIMVTAVDPDFDIVDMAFDEYLCKPVNRNDLFDAIEKQLKAEKYDDRLREFISLNTKIDLLEEEQSQHSIDEADQIDEIRQRVDELERDLIDAVGNGEDPTTVLERFV